LCLKAVFGNIFVFNTEYWLQFVILKPESEYISYVYYLTKLLLSPPQFGSALKYDKLFVETGSINFEAGQTIPAALFLTQFIE